MNPKIQPFFSLLLPLALSSAVACADSQAEPQEPRADQVAAPIAVQTLAPDSLEARRASPSPEELAELIRTIAPQKARNGELRFSDERLDRPEAAKHLLDRLTSARDDENVRNALVMALPRTQGAYALDALKLLQSEKSETIRASLVDAMRLSKDSASALEGLKLGMNDGSAVVRARAAFNIGRRIDGLALSDSLVSGLADADTVVQAASARALGQLGAADAFESVLPLLSSRDADVRLESLRGLGRMDAHRASTLSQLSALEADDDQRVRTAADKVRQRAY